MKSKQNNTATFLFFGLRIVGFLTLIFMVSFHANAQNTKGDQPVPNQRQLRENKFKRIKKPKTPKARDISGRRLRTLNKSSASRANARWQQPDPYSERKSRTADRPASPRGRIFDTPPSDRQRAWKGNVSGHKIRVQSEKARSARSNVFPQRGPYVNNPSKKPQTKPRIYTRTASGAKPIKRIPQDRQRAWKGDIKGGPVGTPSRSGQNRKIFPQKGPFVNHYSKSGRDIQRTYPNNSKISKAAKRETGKPPGKRLSRFPGSRSGSFIVRGKRNVYWGKFSKGEKAFTRDISGRPLRTRNFKSLQPALIPQDSVRFFGRRPSGDRAFDGKTSGGFLSIFRGKQTLPGAGYKSISGSGKSNRPLPPRAPGMGARGINYSGTFKRGELSPGFSRQGVGFAGNIKSKRSPSGGGSVSGRIWNNRQNPIPVRTPRGGAGLAGYQGNFRRGELQPGFTKQGVGFAGNIKAKRPDKGGGSISGKRWNNRNTPIPVRTPRGGAGIGDYSGTFRRGELQPGFTKQGADFAGNTKTKRSEKGGGSISGKLWNNRNTPIPVRTPKGGGGIGDYSGTFKKGELQPGLGKQGADFAGNIKTKRPEKGGGSISGKLWNNQGNPLPGRTPPGSAREAAGYPGNYKLFDLYPSRIYQGEEFTGHLKAKKPKKGAGGSISGKLWNNNEEPIQVRTPGVKEGDYEGRIKLSGLRKNYVQNPNASKESIKKQRPDKTTYEVAGLQVRVREGDYKNKPNAAKGSLPGVAPSRSSVKASEYARGVKMNWSYKHNPVSADEALKGRAPGRAYAKVGDYQGNVKMKKFNDGKLHPDSKFAHGFRDNVKGERTILMNFKLMWAKLFKKSDTQPDHLKEKERRPRYDKREKGLWYE